MLTLPFDQDLLRDATPQLELLQRHTVAQELFFLTSQSPLYTPLSVISLGG